MDVEDRDDNRFVKPWSLDDTEPEVAEPLVIDLSDAILRPLAAAHCVACQGRDIKAVGVSNGARYELCGDCGRVWLIRDGRLQLVVDAELRAGR